MKKPFSHHRIKIIAAVLVLELVGAVYAYQWNPFGIVEKDGVVYELPRDDQPMGPQTRLFKKELFETVEDGQKHVLTYYWRKPPDAKPGKTYPLLLILHGRQGHAWAAQYLTAGKLGDEFPAYILVPTAPVSHGWAVPMDDPGYAPWREHQALPGAMEILHKLMKENAVDPKRVYIVGCSEGGIAAFASVLRYPDVFAAAVAISGTWSLNDTPKMTKVPLWVIHGTGDPDLSADKAHAIADSIRAHGGDARYTEIPALGHNCHEPSLYSSDLWQWLFSQKKA